MLRSVCVSALVCACAGLELGGLLDDTTLAMLASSGGGDDRAKLTTKNYTAVAMALAEMEPADALKVLNTEDPFGVHDIKSADGFTCDPGAPSAPAPAKNRTNMLSRPGSLLFYQHISKAGGTSFCSLAGEQIRRNNALTLEQKPGSAVACEGPLVNPSSQADGRMLVANIPTNDPRSTAPAAFVAQAQSQKLRVFGNEWDPFPTDILPVVDEAHEPVVLVTMLREPNALLLSYYKFFFLPRYVRLHGWKTLEELPYEYTFRGWVSGALLGQQQAGDNTVVGIHKHQETKGSYCRVFRCGALAAHTPQADD
jgi:hypothetical protein